MSKPASEKLNIFSIILILTGLYILFIWWHSTLTADESTVESTSVLAFIINFLKSLGINAQITDYIIRKTAHFCEFALLGFLCALYSYAKFKKIFVNSLSIGFVCVATAVIDELIQINSAGRSAEVTDVALDFSGAVCGLLFFVIIILVIKLFKRIKQR